MGNIIKEYEKSFKENRELPALTDYLSGKTYSYLELAAKVAENHRFFAEFGIQKGDKIALIGKNSIDWVCVYISVITYGAVIVPILADFNPIDMAGIINHSDAKLLYADRQIHDKLSSAEMPGLIRSFVIEEIPEPQASDFEIDNLSYADLGDDDVMIISYTSGTTGTSKGVMLPVRSITHNVEFAIEHNFHFKGSRVLGLLPLAHAYGCAFDMLTPLSVGSHIWLLGRIPSPKVLVDALKKVRPHLICTVPLVMEKMIRKRVMPMLQTPKMKFLLALPIARSLIYKKVGQQLRVTFGGALKEVNMGGAALAPDVEAFLRRAKFPFTVGYGMTETGPLISYDPTYRFKSSSCGTILPGMEVKVVGEGYKKGEGEICVRGVNVMTGYYKNEEATAAAIRDGWLHTGDVGYVDKNGTIYLRGRCKSMILTSSGQNIYPEEIEGKLNNLSYVAESLVFEDKGKLIALVLPDFDAARRAGVDTEALRTLMKENMKLLNTIVAPYEKIAEIRLCSEAFEKTPKQSIKRFLYPQNAKYL